MIELLSIPIAAIWLVETSIQPPPEFQLNPIILFDHDPPTTAISLAPKLSSSPDGRSALLSWLERIPVPSGSASPEEPPQFRLRFARFQDEQWSDPWNIVERVPFFANWADVPSILETPDGCLVAHWLEKSGDGTYAYDVRLARSTDGGASWTKLGPAHNDGTETEHGFVSMVTEDEGARVFWLDGREMADPPETPSATEPDDHGHGSGNMTLRTALVRDRVSGGIMLDDRVCECCGTAAITTPSGPMIFFRDRGLDEARDIWSVRYDGMEWTAPSPVHEDGWIIPGCPVNGPAAAAHESNIVVAWYTAADSQPQIKAAYSTDGGESFQSPLILATGQPQGRVDVILDDRGEAIVIWLDMGSMSGVIMARRIAPDGRQGPSIRLTRSSINRSSGFPRLTRLGDRFLLVWTEDEPMLRIRASIGELSAIPALQDDNVPVPD